MSESNKFSIIPDYGDPNNPNIRAKYGYLEAAVSIFGNILLFLIKLLLGLFINSIALIADGVHSLSDVSTSSVVIFGFRIAKKKPDKDHPFGHGRAEYIATLIIAIILILVGLGFIQQSIERIINMESISHQEYAIIITFIVLISAVFKELMARYSTAISKKINSDVLKADAWHHRSDAISSIGVAIGILGARFGFPILDPIFGIFVAVIIIYVGIDLMRKSSNYLLGTKIEKETTRDIKEIIKETKYAEGIHKIFLHDYGTNKVITLHVEIDPKLSVEKAHSIADIIEQKIQEKIKCTTVIHLEPKNKIDDCKKDNKIIEKILKTQKEVKSYHKIHIIKGIGKDDIKMHLIVNHDMPIEKAHKLCHKIENILQKTYGSCNVDIHFEPCGNNCRICKITCKERR